MRDLVLALEKYRCSTMDEGEKRLAGMEEIIKAAFAVRDDKVVEQRDALIRAAEAATQHPSYETYVVLARILTTVKAN